MSYMCIYIPNSTQVTIKMNTATAAPPLPAYTKIGALVVDSVIKNVHVCVAILEDMHVPSVSM